MRFLWLVSGRHQRAQKEVAPQDFVLLTYPSSIQTPTAVKNRSISGHHCLAMSPAALCIKTSTLKPCEPCSHPTGREIPENPNGTIVSLGKGSHHTPQIVSKLDCSWSQDKRKSIMTLDASKMVWLLGYLLWPRTHGYPAPLPACLRIKRFKFKVQDRKNLKAITYTEFGKCPLFSFSSKSEVR